MKKHQKGFHTGKNKEFSSIGRFILVVRGMQGEISLYERKQIQL